MTLFGPDVSGYQRGLQLAPGTPFAAAKATEGTGWTDDTYPGFKEQAARIGAIFWAYHFLDQGNAAAQAAHAHAVVGDTPLMLDWEGIKNPATGAYTSRPTLADACVFTDTYRQLGGRIWSTYLPPWYWSDPGGLASPSLAPIARRGLALISSNYPQSGYSDSGPGWNPYGGMNPALWQYTDSQQYGGRPVDFNAYRGTAAQLAALVAGQPGTPAAATTTVQALPTPRGNDMHADLQLNKPVVFTNPAAVLAGTAYLLLAADFGDATVRVAQFSLKAGGWVITSYNVGHNAGAIKVAMTGDTNKASVEMTAGNGTVGLDVLGVTATSVFRSLRADLALEAAHYHPAAQAGRFLSVFAGALALQVSTHGSIAGWSDLRAAVLAGLPVAYRQWRRTMPVATVRRTVDEHEAALAVTTPPRAG